MEQVAIADVLRRHLKLVIAVPVIAVLVGYALSFLITDQYTSTAVVLVRPQQQIKATTSKEDTKEFLDFSMGNAAVETAAKTYIEIIKSPALISEVVSELGLDKKAQDDEKKSKLGGFLPTYLQPAQYGLSLKNLIPFLKYGRLIEDDPFTKAVKEVTGSLKAEAQLDTYIFEITYTAREPQLAADVVNTTARTLVRFVDKLGLSEARYQDDLLKAELEQKRKQLDVARERLESYKKAHSVFLPTSEYDAQLKVIGELEVELAKAEATLVASQNTLTAASLAARRATLLRMIGERKAALAPLPGIERDLTQLQQDVTFAAAAYELVDKEFEEAHFKLSYAAPEARVVSEAVVPRLPSSPARGIIALACLLGGLVVAVGLAFFVEYINRQIRGVEDVEDFVGVKVLATIPHVSANRWQHAGLL